MCQCSFGVAPASLNVLPDIMVMVEGVPAATIMANTPANLPTFGMCTTLSNPTVASATAAALGVLTPMPCVPVLAPWIPVSMTLLGGQPALTASSTCICSWGGVIQITFPGTVKTLY
jgi:hypothetical protein